ncbi:ubiquinone/menaquinone biosynthesis methlytransferase UbiE [Orientia tsutsugamushi str. Ikeda]|uniref:Ubiquinone/menaquinone biosynthesis C-methyltransferase UbiE n=1 Tax=Orientia tsutsugamushi (strain Ikeda) TaxID=334380 RepID=B3CR93_ORITI|nr:bifunctional demethylmenaquinone methyltransferase/2-methoxy-6-polyprenyl-1,4-benzoquinol methylase UbiE [Orientia tsutsugamushi]BAG40076.1 ubiquinone/menaquinone biosynthesis methlytransferase UbiE [Orientia tsutsugamushi str. Ikeda]
MTKNYNHNNGNKSTFGFQLVDSDKKNQLVAKVFDSVTQHYDLMNNILSLGVHYFWKQKFCNRFFDFNGSLIDVASGTGDIALTFYRKAKKCYAIPNVTICDINYNMLQKCREKAVDSNLLENIHYINCNAENLPFADNSFDNFSIAFGIRNVTNIKASLQEAYRVLKPGGQFLCLEFSKVENRYVSKLYDLYSFNLIPLIGKIVANNQQAYQYLVESIRTFPEQQDFCQIINSVGFQNVKFCNLTFGIVAIHSALKL